MTQFQNAGIGIYFGPRVFFALALAVVSALGTSGCKRAAEPSEQAVSWQSVDGVTLHGMVYSASDDPKPGLLLVHDVGGSHADWALFAREMERRGYVCLALDVRGHGDSVTRGDEPISFGSFTAEDWAMAQDDLIAAKRVLLDHGADPSNLFMAGAGLGGSLAIRRAVDDPEIQGVVVLSPQRSTRGISIERVVAENRRLPLLFIAAEGDDYSAKSATALKESSDAYSEIRVYAGSMTGTDIAAANAKVVTDIAEWLFPILE